jgi:hypothetical protein
MSTTQEGIPITKSEDEAKQQNIGEKKDEKLEKESLGEDSNYDNKSVKVTKKGSTKTFTKISFDYDHLNGSSQSASVNLGKPSHFDGIGYSSWQYSMLVYLIRVNSDLWKIVCVDVNVPEEDEPITQEEEFQIQRNMQAASVLLTSLSLEEFDKFDGMDLAK